LSQRTMSNGPIMEKPRLMAGIEHALTISNEFSAFNVVCVVKIEGNLSSERLGHALAAMQRKHRLLRTRIMPRKGSYFFTTENVGPIALEVAGRNAPDDWMAVVEEELDRRMDVNAGPLLRCRFLQNLKNPHGESEVILTFSHTIIDASSGVPLLREFLRACSEDRVDLGPDNVEEGAHSAKELFPNHLSGFGYARGVGAHMMRQMTGEVSYRWRARGCRKAPIRDSGRNKILPMALSKPLTDELIRVSRRKRVTMNAILTAGLMLAAKRHVYPGRDTPFRNITFADLRPYLRTPVADGLMGCYMGMIISTIQMQDRPDFWKLAHDIHEAIYLSNHRGERFISNALSPGMMKMIIGMKAMRMGTTAISYAGPITVGEEKGPIRISGLHAFTTNMTIGPEYSALARLFKGEIWLDNMYMDSDMDKKKAGEIADEIRLILEGAVAPGGRA
jgi:hypothetical protein